MEECANDPTVFIDISTDSLLKDFTEDMPTANEQNEEQPEIKDFVTIASKRIKCPECTRYATDDAEKMTRHIRKNHRGVNPFQCFMCEYSTYNKSIFEEHVRIHKGIKPFKCSYCPHRNVSKKNLKKHEKIHRPDNPLKCPHCDHIARHSRGFAYHAKKYHPVKTEKGVIQCKLCNKTFDSEQLLLMHTSNVKKCKEPVDDASDDKCGYTACTSALIKLHKALEHGKVFDKTKSKKDLFKCAQCEWSSSSKMRILLHLIHHPDQVVDESVLDVSVLRKHGIIV